MGVYGDFIGIVSFFLSLFFPFFFSFSSPLLESLDLPLEKGEGLGLMGVGGYGLAGALREITQGMSMKSSSKWSIPNRSLFQKESTGCPEEGGERGRPGESGGG